MEMIMKKLLLLISIITNVVCVHGQELITAVRSLDVQKVQQLADEAKIQKCTLSEIIPLIEELDGIINNYHKLPHTMVSAGKLAVGMVFFIPAARVVYKSYQYNEDRDSIGNLCYRFFKGYPVRKLAKDSTPHVPHLSLIATSGGIVTASSYFMYTAVRDMVAKLASKNKYKKALTIVTILKKTIVEKYAEHCS